MAFITNMSARVMHAPEPIKEGGEVVGHRRVKMQPGETVELNGTVSHWKRQFPKDCQVRISNRDPEEPDIDEEPAPDADDDS